MSAAQVPRITPEAYLAAERDAEFRSEFIEGEVFAMSGGSRTHSSLISRVAHELEDALEEGPCIVTVADLRLRVGLGKAYLYPDVMVYCGESADDPEDMISNPSVVVEVLSPSTERWNRVGKFELYQQVESVREYLLVSQDEKRVEWFTRRADGEWVYRSASGADGMCALEMLGVTLSLARIYRKTKLANPAVG